MIHRMQIKTKGIILKELANGDDDKLLTILTEDRGVIFAYAKGARRFKNSLAASTGLLCYSSMVLFTNRERFSLDHADTIEQFFGLRQSVEKLALAAYFAEIASVLGPKENDGGQYLKLLLNSLFFLQNDRLPMELLKPLFELRSLSMAGFMPDLVACEGCGCYEAEQMAFYPVDGTICCGECSRKKAGIHIFLTKGTLAAMRHIIYSPIEKLFAFTIGSDSIKILNDTTERFLQSQTERNFQTLDFYRSLTALL